MLKGRVVIHRASQYGEDTPRAPEHHIDQALRLFLLAMLDQHAQGWFTLLSVAGLVGLDAGQHGAECHITQLHGVGSQAQKLQVCEPGFKGKGELDCCGDSIVGGKHVIKEVTEGNHPPVIGMKGLVRPVEAWLFLEQGVRKRELQLAVPDFIQEMRRRGHSEAKIRKVVYENPLAFFRQCKRFEFRPPEGVGR